MLIVSMGVAGLISIFGAFLMVRIVFMIYKVLTKKYSDWISE